MTRLGQSLEPWPRSPQDWQFCEGQARRMFLHVVAQLKLAWRHDHRKDPGKVLKPQLGKGFWATRGRYLNRALLLALADDEG